MPGETQDIGHAKARWLQDYQEKYLNHHVVVAFKSVKAEFGASQVDEYKMDGYEVLEDSRHPDGVVMGLPIDEYNVRRAAERELQALPSATFNVDGHQYDQEVTAVAQRPISRKQMEDEYGVAKQAPYRDAPEDVS